VSLALVVLFSVLSTYSRVYVGVHYPSDLIGGALLGTLCAVAVLQFELLMRRIIPVIRNKLSWLKKSDEPSKDEG